MYSFVSEEFVPNRDIALSIVAVKGTESADRIAEIARCAQSRTSDLVVLVIVGELPRFHRATLPQLKSKAVVILDAAALKEIGMSSDPGNAFRVKVLPAFPLRALSPYTFNGPVTGETFIGRTSELRRIIETRETNFCIVGARKIGKTSLLKAAKNSINDAGVLPNTVAVYVDGTNAMTIDRLRWGLCQETWNVIKDPELFDSDISLEAFGRLLKKSDKKFVFLIDEVDGLLSGPDAVEFERFMRNLSNENYARFVLCGYRVLRDRVTDRMSNIYNLCDPLPLGPLNKQEAFELVKRPMEKIGVKFRSESVIDQIIEQGSTVAWLLQFFCDNLLARLDGLGKERCVDDEDVASVAQGAEFSQLLTGLVDQDSGMPTLERLIIYIHVAEDGEALTESDIGDSLERHVSYIPFTAVRGALNYLTETYIFSEKHHKYRFFIPQLKFHLRRQERDVAYVLRALSNQLRREIRE